MHYPIALYCLPCLIAMANRMKATLEGTLGKSLYVMM